ncbi:hypothetical protein MIND_00877300 [Mycena indigotica]|uniref:Uncharacterized protein n=1 Tax=Mycena indigotica TaxID=2126181 RepID=A0A8H6SH54_9AGAR|nr:uncharacterized protein MIND_00877300 [Mycena indigotica]KAF7299284.1 hypothetical protein MIND_00877300 [Mycena indigotica]
MQTLSTISMPEHTIATSKPSPVESIDDAAPILSTLLSMAFSNATRPINEQLVSESACKQILSTQSRLYQLLRANKVTFPQVFDSPLFPPLVSTAILEYLDTLRPHLEQTSASDEIFERWMPRARSSSPIYSDADVISHFEALNLQRVSRTGGLRIILYNLGRFKQNPALCQRLERLFSPTDKFFVNSTGTGKTRLCFEGLCSNWGLYFTFAVGHRNLGSHDLQLAIRKRCGWGEGFNDEELDHDQMREQNTACALRYFGAILLARLLVFQMFLEIVVSRGGLKEEHKARWLQTQLTSHRFTMMANDAFGSLADLLVTHETPFLQSNIDDVLRKIHTVIGRDEPLLIVLDEAQLACDILPNSFGDGQPLLWEIIRGWKALTRGTCKIICVGNHITPPMFTDSFEQISETSCFDDPDTHETYINQFLPPKLRDSPSGRFLVARLWRWCRGRYWLTDEFLEMLLAEGLQFPHNCLSVFIERTTEAKPFDAVKTQFEEGLPRGYSWASRVSKASDFSNLFPDQEDLILDLLYCYMTTHNGRSFGPGENLDLLRKDYVLFAKADMSRVSFDEPLFLIRAARRLFPFPVKWILRDRPHRHPATFISSLRLNPPRTRESLAHCYAFYVTQVLGEPRLLLDIVNFPHVVPAWAHQTAQLVRFFVDEQGDFQRELGLIDAYQSLRPLATTTATLEETTRWINHEYGTIFCIPSSPNVDLLYALQLADKSRIWVAVRLFATDEPVMPDELSPAISLLDIDSLFVETPADFVASRRAADGLRSLPNVRQRPCVLRTISSFPVEVDLCSSVYQRSRDVAHLSFTKLRFKESQVMQEDFFAAIVNGVIAGTKRKSRWDDGSMHMERKKARVLLREMEFKPPTIWGDDASEYSDPEDMHEEPDFTWDVRSDDLWRESWKEPATKAPPPPRKPRKRKTGLSKPKPEPVAKAKGKADRPPKKRY